MAGSKSEKKPLTTEQVEDILLNYHRTVKGVGMFLCADAALKGLYKKGKTEFVTSTKKNPMKMGRAPTSIGNVVRVKRNKSDKTFVDSGVKIYPTLLLAASDAFLKEYKAFARMVSGQISFGFDVLYDDDGKLREVKDYEWQRYHIDAINNYEHLRQDTLRNEAMALDMMIEQISSAVDSMKTLQESRRNKRGPAAGKAKARTSYVDIQKEVQRRLSAANYES